MKSRILNAAINRFKIDIHSTGFKKLFSMFCFTIILISFVVLYFVFLFKSNKSIGDDYEVTGNAISKTLRSLRNFKNPTLDGITISSNRGICIISPREYTSVFFDHVISWAKNQGYDAIIFGQSYSGLNGVLYWTDGINTKFDTDFELILNILHEKGYNRIFSFVSNPERRNFQSEVKTLIVGELIESEEPIKSFGLFTSGIRKIIKAENFHAVIENGKFLVAKYPAEKNSLKIISTGADIDGEGIITSGYRKAKSGGFKLWKTLF